MPVGRKSKTVPFGRCPHCGKITDTPGKLQQCEHCQRWVTNRTFWLGSQQWLFARRAPNGHPSAKGAQARAKRKSKEETNVEN